MYYQRLKWSSMWKCYDVCMSIKFVENEPQLKVTSWKYNFNMSTCIHRKWPVTILSAVGSTSQDCTFSTCLMPKATIGAKHNHQNHLWTVFISKHAGMHDSCLLAKKTVTMEVSNLTLTVSCLLRIMVRWMFKIILMWMFLFYINKRFVYMNIWKQTLAVTPLFCPFLPLAFYWCYQCCVFSDWGSPFPTSQLR